MLTNRKERRGTLGWSKGPRKSAGPDNGTRRLVLYFINFITFIHLWATIHEWTAETTVAVSGSVFKCLYLSLPCLLFIETVCRRESFTQNEAGLTATQTEELVVSPQTQRGNQSRRACSADK